MKTKQKLLESLGHPKPHLNWCHQTSSGFPSNTPPVFPRGFASNGQVWSLEPLEGKLSCGSTYIVKWVSHWQNELRHPWQTANPGKRGSSQLSLAFLMSFEPWICPWAALPSLKNPHRLLAGSSQCDQRCDLTQYNLLSTDWFSGHVICAKKNMEKLGIGILFKATNWGLGIHIPSTNGFVVVWRFEIPASPFGMSDQGGLTPMKCYPPIWRFPES